MPKDNKCNPCLKDAQTDGSNRNMAVQLLFDILSGRLWSSPFTTNVHISGQSVITQTEERSTTQLSSNNTICIGEHTIDEQPTIPTNGRTTRVEERSDTDRRTENEDITQQPQLSSPVYPNDIDTGRTSNNNMIDHADTVATNSTMIEFREIYTRSDADSAPGISSATNTSSRSDGLSFTTPNVTDTALPIERLDSRVEADAKASYQDYFDITERNRFINRELHEESVHQPDSNEHLETIYERHIQPKVEKAVDLIEQKTEDALLDISREGRAALKDVNEHNSVKLKDSEKGKKDILILHSDEDKALAYTIMETIINESDQTVGILVDVYEHILVGQSKVNCIDDLFSDHRLVLFLVTPEFEHNGFHNFQGGALFLKELEDYRGTNARFVPLLYGVKKISRAWLRALQPMFFPHKNFINMIVKLVHTFRNDKQ